VKILVVGNEKAVLGFSLAGVHGTAVTSAQEASDALDDAFEKAEAGIILVTEDVAAMIEARMDQLKLRSTIPLVVEIPGPEGNPAGRQSLNEIVLRAIGVRF
jgi:V/A-type H+/Na+-transporting ATPase subunit F